MFQNAHITSKVPINMYLKINTIKSNLGWNKISVDELQQGGLSSSVGPDQGQPRVEVEAELKVLVDYGSVLAVTETHVLRNKNK